MFKNVEQNPLRWLQLAYDRSQSAPRNLAPPAVGEEWNAYDWDNPRCGTPKPKPRPGHGTLFLRWDGHTSPCEIPEVTKAAEELKMATIYTHGDLIDSPARRGTNIPSEFAGIVPSYREDPPGFFLFRNKENPKFSKEPLAPGLESARNKTFMGPKTMDIWPAADVFCDAKEDDPWYGPVLIAQSRSNVGLAFLRSVASSTEPGKAVLVEHVSKTVSVDDADSDLLLRIITGTGDDSIPETNARDLLFGDMDGHANYRRELATRFHLFEKGVEVARCHISYHDASNKSVIGPSIEMIETATSHRGRGHLRCLYSHVEKYFFHIWRLRRIPGSFADGKKFGRVGQPGYILKATKLSEQQVERKKSRVDGGGTAITDKRFLIDCGFQIRTDVMEGISPLAKSVFSGYQADDEMMKYVVTTEFPKSSKAVDKLFVCENCKTEGQSDTHKKCKRCLCVRYCCVECQTEDWPFHRLWCNKSSESILKKLIDLKIFEDAVDEQGKGTRTNRTNFFLSGDVSASEMEAVFVALKIAPGDPRRASACEEHGEESRKIDAVLRSSFPHLQ